MPFSFKKYSYILPAIIISLLFVTPFIVSNELYNELIVAKEFWFFGVVAVMLLYSAIQLIVKSEKLTVKLNLPDILLLIFYMWCFIRACFTPYTPFYYNHKLQLLTGCMVVYFFIKWAIVNERNEKNEYNENNAIQNNSFISRRSFITSFLIFSFLLSGFLQAVYGLLQLYGVYPSNHSLFKITGSFFNPAPYALYLAVVFPMALGTYLFTMKELKNGKNEGNEEDEDGTIRNNSFISRSSFIPSFFNPYIKYFSLATVIAILLILPATMIRAAWVGALAGSLVVLQFRYNLIGKIKFWLNNKLKKVIVCAFALIIIASTIVGLYKLKEGSSVGKSFIWEVTLGKIAEKPLLGHGLGRFEAEYNNWQAEYFQKHPAEMNGPKGMAAGNTKYCFNDYLEMASEVGILGLGLFVALIITLIIGITKKLRNEDNERMYIIFCISSLFSFLIVAFVSFPFYNIPLLILMFIMMRIFSDFSNTKYTKQLPVVVNYIGALLLTCCSIGLIFSQYYKYLACRNWQQAHFSYEVGAYVKANGMYANNLTNLKFEGLYLQQYGKSLQMVGKNEEAIKFLEQAQQISNDYILCCNLGEALIGINEYEKAELAYLRASKMMPNKLYPIYLLAKLYVNQNSKEKAFQLYKRLLLIKPKNNSDSVTSIKKQIIEILDNKNNSALKHEPKTNAFILLI